MVQKKKKKSDVLFLLYFRVLNRPLVFSPDPTNHFLVRRAKKKVIAYAQRSLAVPPMMSMSLPPLVLGVGCVLGVVLLGALVALWLM